MTVSELIEELQQVPDENTKVVMNDHNGMLLNIGYVDWTTKETLANQGITNQEVKVYLNA